MHGLLDLHLQTAVVTYSGVKTIIRGALPAANPLASSDPTQPTVLSDCYTACTVLFATAGVTVNYFRCYNYTLSNNDNYNTINLVNNYPSCNGMLLLLMCPKIKFLYIINRICN